MSRKGLPSLLDRHWAESALAIGAIVIAAASLWVAFDSERTNRELVASASWPFVQFYDNLSPGPAPRLSFVISNDGIGPAKLESFELFWNGHPQRSPWQLLQTCCAQGVSLETLHQTSGLVTSTVQGMVLRAGSERDFLTLTRDADNAALWNSLVSQFTGTLSVRYCYCSAFDECWVTSAIMGRKRDLNPRQVRACARPRAPYDNTPG